MMETEEEFYESFRKELAEQYCYSVYAHIAPDGKRYIGYSKAVRKRFCVISVSIRRATAVHDMSIFA